MPPHVDCSIATASAKHIIGIPHTRRKNTVSKSRESSIQTLHTDLEAVKHDTHSKV